MSPNWGNDESLQGTMGIYVCSRDEVIGGDDDGVVFNLCMQT